MKSKEIIEHIPIKNDVLFAEVSRFLREGNQVTIPAKGNSMVPTIRSNIDTIILTGIESSSPEGNFIKAKVDDIVLFRYKGKWILHRIISINDGVAVVRGDGNSFCEYPRVEDIYGKAIFILRNDKTKVDPYSRKALCFLRIWNFLLPLRRYILAIYHRLPFHPYFP